LYRQQGSVSGALGVWLRYDYDESGNGYLYYGFNKLGTGWQWSWQWDQKPASVTTFPLNQWTHVAFTKSGSTVKTYVNGVENHGITLDPIRLGTPASPDGQINVGGDPYEGNYFDGRIDEVQFWNTALTQSDISNWMYSEIDERHSNYDNLVYYYKLNEGTGTSTVTDTKGLCNGTMINMSEAAWVNSDIKGWITDEDTPISGYLFGSYPSGLVYELVSNGLKGTAVITGANQFTYTPAADENGSDTFTYRVRDAEGNYSNTQSVNITINPVGESDKTITSFSFAGLYPAATGIINEELKTIKLMVPNGTNLTALVPTIEHNGFSISPESGIAQNFAVPVTYTVTAEDGSTQVYTVTVESPVAGIATSGGNTSFTGDKAVVVDPNLLLIGDDLDGARVMIENMKPGDVLGILELYLAE
jgi:hypothetical protein